MQLTETQARHVLLLRDVWATFEDIRGRRDPQPMRACLKKQAGDAMALTMGRLATLNALRFVPGYAYVPGQRWAEAVAAAEAVLGEGGA